MWKVPVKLSTQGRVIMEGMSGCWFLGAMGSFLLRCALGENVLAQVFMHSELQGQERDGALFRRLTLSKFSTKCAWHISCPIGRQFPRVPALPCLGIPNPLCSCPSPSHMGAQDLLGGDTDLVVWLKLVNVSTSSHEWATDTFSSLGSISSSRASSLSGGKTPL